MIQRSEYNLHTPAIHRFAWHDIALVSLGLLILSGPRFSVSDDAPRQLILLTPLLLTLSVKWRRLPRRRTTGMLPLWLFCGLALASSAWSTDGWGSLNHALLAIVAVAFGSLAGRVLHGPVILATVITACAMACLASLVSAIADPLSSLETGVYQNGALQGIFNHRNQLAYVSSIGLIATIASSLFKAPGGRVVTMILLVLFTSTLWRANSLTATLVSGLAILLLLSIRLLVGFSLRYRLLGASLVLLSAAPIALLSATRADASFASLGRDGSFTGRTEIWATVWEAAQSHAWIGYGWGGMWIETSPLQQQISALLGFRLYHSHNGYLDTILQVGFLGLAALLITLGLVALRAFRVVFHSKKVPVIAAVALALLLILTTSSVTESHLAHYFGLSLLALLGGALSGYSRIDAPISHSDTRNLSIDMKKA